jgi:hypothetical protein
MKCNSRKEKPDCLLFFAGRCVIFHKQFFTSSGKGNSALSGGQNEKTASVEGQ